MHCSLSVQQYLDRVGRVPYSGTVSFAVRSCERGRYRPIQDFIGAQNLSPVSMFSQGQRCTESRVRFCCGHGLRLSGTVPLQTCVTWYHCVLTGNGTCQYCQCPGHRFSDRFMSLAQSQALNSRIKCRVKACSSSTQLSDQVLSKSLPYIPALRWEPNGVNRVVTEP